MRRKTPSSLQAALSGGMGDAFATLVQKLVDQEIQRRMTLPALRPLHGEKSYEATCGKCLAFGWAEGDPEQAWSKLVEIGWIFYKFNAGGRGYAVCPSCRGKLDGIPAGDPGRRPAPRAVGRGTIRPPRAT